MVSTKHKNALEYFQRDVDCIHTFFEKKFGYTSQVTLDLAGIKRTKNLDNEVKASGHIKKELQDNVDDLDILDEY